MVDLSVIFEELSYKSSTQGSVYIILAIYFASQDSYRQKLLARNIQYPARREYPDKSVLTTVS
jgi:hypothetical protein